MHLKKNVILGFFVLILFIGTILTSCGGNNMHPVKALNNFSKLIEKGNLDDLSLTIYYIDPSTCTLKPLSIDELLNMENVKKIVVKSNELKEHIDLLNKINSDAITPVKDKPRIDARVYYVFETKKGGKIFSVAMWGEDNSIFVNDVAVKDDDVFYNAIIPFVPEDIVKELNPYINK